MSDSWLLGSAELKSPAVSQCSHSKYMNVFMVACLKPPVHGTIVEEIYSPYVPNHWVTNLHKKKAIDNMTLTAIYFPLLSDLPAMYSNLPLFKKNLPKSIMKNIFLSLYLAPCAYRPVPNAQTLIQRQHDWHFLACQTCRYESCPFWHAHLFRPLQRVLMSFGSTRDLTIPCPAPPLTLIHQPYP